MVRIRLTRIGRKNAPRYRMVITPRREKRDSKAIEYVGFYHPFQKQLTLKKERIEYWLSVGAQPSDTVQRMLIKEKIIKAPKVKKSYNKKPGIKAAKRKENKEKEKGEN